MSHKQRVSGQQNFEHQVDFSNVVTFNGGIVGMIPVHYLMIVQISQVAV